jgi:hypothetical protein
MVREIFNPMVREMRYYDPTVGYGSFETQIRHQDAGAILRGCSFMSAMSSSGGRTEARSDSRIDNEPDPFADYHNVEPMKFPENCDDIVKQSWYHKGRIDGQKEQFEKLMPVIDGMLDRTIR